MDQLLDAFFGFMRALFLLGLFVGLAIAAVVVYAVIVR